MQDLKAMNCVIVGGGGGIGRGIALSLAKRGAHVMLADLRIEPAQAVADEVAALGVRSLAAAIDVTKDEQVQALARQAFDRFGIVNLVVNCPGISLWSRLEDATMAQWHKVMDINLYGIVRTCGAFLPGMKAQQPAYSHLVNVASMTALFAFPVLQNGIYSASKAALLSYSDCLRLEEAGNGILVSVPIPGSVATDLQANSAAYVSRIDPSAKLNAPPPISPGSSAEEVGETIVRGIALGRFLIPTHGFLRERVADRYAAYLEDFDALAAG